MNKCPFCGSENIIGAGTHEYSFYICKDCKEYFYEKEKVEKTEI